MALQGPPEACLDFQSLVITQPGLFPTLIFTSPLSEDEQFRLHEALRETVFCSTAGDERPPPIRSVDIKELSLTVWPELASSKGKKPLVNIAFNTLSGLLALMRILPLECATVLRLMPSKSSKPKTEHFSWFSKSMPCITSLEFGKALFVDCSVHLGGGSDKATLMVDPRLLLFPNLKRITVRDVAPSLYNHFELFVDMLEVRHLLGHHIQILSVQKSTAFTAQKLETLREFVDHIIVDGVESTVQLAAPGPALASKDGVDC